MCVCVWRLGASVGVAALASLQFSQAKMLFVHLKHAYLHGSSKSTQPGFCLGKSSLYIYDYFITCTCVCGGVGVRA